VSRLLDGVEVDANEYSVIVKDAERYQWLRDQLTHQHCGPTVGWGTDVLYPGDDPDAAIDAAMKVNHER
jgi:hypothetical protein